MSTDEPAAARDEDLPGKDVSAVMSVYLVESPRST